MSINVSNNHLSIAPRKVRLVADLVRKKKVADAIRTLRFCEKKEIAIVITKLVNSALAIASADQKYDIDNLIIGKITVDEGPTFKRIMPRAQGRAYRVRHRSSHIKLELVEG